VFQTKSKCTTDHGLIRNWIEKRAGHPIGFAGVKTLRITFPGRYSSRHAHDGSRHISWDEFFCKFEAQNLAFRYQEETRTGEESNFFRFVNRHSRQGEVASCKRAIPLQTHTPQTLIKPGALDRIRTGNPLITSEVLYRVELRGQLLTRSLTRKGVLGKDQQVTAPDLSGPPAAPPRRPPRGPLPGWRRWS
jgi:hypothetical protein